MDQINLFPQFDIFCQKNNIVLLLRSVSQPAMNRDWSKDHCPLVIFVFLRVRVRPESIGESRYLP